MAASGAGAGRSQDQAARPPPCWRLDQRLALLTGGLHDVPARQRTLRDEIAWSYNLLAPGEQLLFMAVVPGVHPRSGPRRGHASGDLAIDFLEGVTTLLDQNLLKSLDRRDGEARLGMLETIREYGLEQLAAAGEMRKFAVTMSSITLPWLTQPLLYSRGQAGG